MKSKGKMPDKVRSIKFTGSQSECEILVSDSQSTPVQLLAGAKRPRAGEPNKDVAVKKVRNKGQATASTNDADVVEAPANKLTVYTRCSPKVVHAACRLLSPVHLQTLSRLGLGNIADMTLDGLEQPELTSWLMDRTDPETMTIQIADNKKIAITPWKVSIVMGTPFGGEPLQYPDHKRMSDAFSQLANELGVDSSSSISAEMLLQELKQRKDDPSAARFFIMILTNKLLLPSTKFYISTKDAWLGMDLCRVAKIDWSKAVFDALHDSILSWHKSDGQKKLQTYICSCVVCLILLYIDNLYVGKPGLMVDRLHTPRIQLYTKDLVEKIYRFKDENDKIVFGQLNFNGILASCYSHPDYDKDKEPRGDNAGTPFAEELVSAVHISFPSMFDTIGPHLSGLPDDQKKPVLVALGEYDRQAKISATNISRIIRSVQISHARVSDHIVSIIRGTLPTHQSYKGAQSSTDKQSNLHDDPVGSPPILFDATHVAEPSHKASTPPNNESAKVPAATVVDPTRTGGSVLPTRQILGDLVIPDDPQQAVQGLDGISSDEANKLPVQQTVSVGIQARVTGDDSTDEFSHAEVDPQLYTVGQQCSPASNLPKELIDEDKIPSPDNGDAMTSQQSTDGRDDFTSLSLPPDELLSDSQLAQKIDQICRRECQPIDTMKDGCHQGDVGAIPESKSNPPPLRRTHRRTKRPARFRSTPKAGQGKPVVNSAATQLFDMVLSDPNRYGSAIIIQSEHCFANANDIFQSFSIGHTPHGMFIDAFADFLGKEDVHNNPDSATKRIFIPTTISTLLNIENVTRDSTQLKFNLPDLVDQLCSSLGNLVLPVIHNDHWSLYVIYHNKKCFDILDSKNYELIGESETQHHSSMAQKILKRLSDGFQQFTGGKYPKFGNYRKGYIKCPKMPLGSKDSAFYVMTFMEKFDGDANKITFASHMDSSKALRAHILHHLIFNRFNIAQDLHHDIELFR
uniref:Ubiquitin-like protease family profile domain-containing protein n=2 Tax=Oryza punctata TaxID=4537 RepID=A0A0E0JHX3_ORYPU